MLKPEPKIALAVITDGRGEYLKQTIASLSPNLGYGFDGRFLIDDSGDPEYAAWLDDEFPHFKRWSHLDRSGLAASVHSAWILARDSGADFLWHQEDDFTFTGPVDLGAMAGVLDEQSHLAQLSLKRQPVNHTEVAAGGFMEVAPWAYIDHRDDSGARWVEQEQIFSFNPCLIPRRVLELCLAGASDGLERGVTDTLLAAGYRFGILGTITDPPRVTHIGASRSSGWKV